jgi:hypothetical protein
VGDRKLEELLLVYSKRSLSLKSSSLPPLLPPVIPCHHVATCSLVV